MKTIIIRMPQRVKMVFPAEIKNTIHAKRKLYNPCFQRAYTVSTPFSGEPRLHLNSTVSANGKGLNSTVMDWKLVNI